MGVGRDGEGGGQTLGRPDEVESGQGGLRLRYQELFEFSPDGQLLTDRHGVIREANQAAAALLRCPKEFLLDKPLGLFLAAGYRPQFYRALATLLAIGHAGEFESKTGGIRGALLDVAIRAVLVVGQGGAPDSLRWLIRDIGEQKRAEAARVDLLRRLVSAQEDERRRVARELHDSIGQLTAALAMTIQSVRDAGPLPDAALARLDDVQRVADELGRASHDLAMRLRPTALDDLGLEAALRQLVRDWSGRSGVEAHFEAVGLAEGRLPPDVETAFYRIVQESLTNILKHAGARIVSVVVERRAGLAQAVVEDDGAGFDPGEASSAGRLGLRGMGERMALIGGALEVESSPGAGTTVIARVELQPRDGASPVEGVP